MNTLVVFALFLEIDPIKMSPSFKLSKPCNLTKFSPDSTTVKSLSILLIIIFSPIVKPASCKFNLNLG